LGRAATAPEEYKLRISDIQEAAFLTLLKASWSETPSLLPASPFRQWVGWRHVGWADASGAMRRRLNSPWTGNFRARGDAIECGFVRCNQKSIDLSDLPVEIP